MAEPHTFAVSEEDLFLSLAEYGEWTGDNQLATHARNMINAMVPSAGRRPRYAIRAAVEMWFLFFWSRQFIHSGGSQEAEQATRALEESRAGLPASAHVVHTGQDTQQ